MNTNKKEKYHASDLKLSIIKMASELLMDEGIEAITMREIATKLNVSRGAPYRHFDSKHHLLCAIAQHYFERLNTSMLITTVVEVDPKKELYQLAEKYIDFCLSHPAIYHLMFNNSELSNNQTSELTASGYKLFNRLETLLEKFQQASIIKQENINLQANYVWSALHGYCCLLLYQETKKVEKLVTNKKFFLDKIWKGLLIN
ncbi:TetR/AcrR family transcriptional regulator [Psychromonas algicola]|uniref:TetR/AcrR family transcriptional regulator n=1 Tax=Psychromonas algicola TaxID=2555642 RepID=UPI00106838E3|nr:TetR/AcrR family transcriptional regulator [Psychromonas sp. RZ5]TEW51475.1 TetR/AcrR family transcriptional regulator [Psychromonas sp. RZ5]